MNNRTILLVRVASTVDKVDHPQFFDPCYQLKYVEAGLAKLGDVEVHSHDCWLDPLSIDALVDVAARLKPDVVIVHSSSFDVSVANEFTVRLKAQGLAQIVIGVGQGQYLNHDSGDPLSAEYDAVLLGECEVELVRLIGRIRTGDPTWRDEYRELFAEAKRFVVEDLDALPFPSYTHEEMRRYRSIYPLRLFKRVVWGFMIAGRGCPYACSFCSEVMRVSVGTKMRIRSGASVVDEMQHLMRQGANMISFQDDSFASSKAMVRDICNTLIERGVKVSWMARLRADEVDHDLLELMRDAGCIMLGIGIEAGAQRVIDRMRKTYKPKPWPDLVRQTFRWTRELGIGTNAYYVIGNPTETYEEIEHTIELALEAEADSIQVHFHTPYPGSADWDEYREAFGEHAGAMFHYAEPEFSLADVTPAQLVELRSKFYKRYLLRPGFALRHMWHHAPFYMRNPDIFFTLLGIRKIFGSGSKGSSPVADEHAAADVVLTPAVPPTSDHSRPSKAQREERDRVSH